MLYPSLELERKTVFVRLDLNVPLALSAEELKRHPRIRNAIPTLQYVLDKTHKVIIASHLGRPKGKVVPELSLAAVGNVLADILAKEVVLLEDYRHDPPSMFLKNLLPNQVLLLENLRFHPQEKAADLAFATHLAKGVDVYINDAFGVCHRSHTSVMTLPQVLGKEKCFAGYSLQGEVRVLGNVLAAPDQPFCVVMGGAKVSDKLGALLGIMEKARWVLLGGAMAYPFLQAVGEIPSASANSKDLELARLLLANAKERHVDIRLPKDHVVAKEFSESAEFLITEDSSIPEGNIALDIGPQTIADYRSVMEKSSTILWNGPMGVCEWGNFAKGSEAIADIMAGSEATTIVGGGDSLSLLLKLGLDSSITHLSTGGGAMLEFLEHSFPAALRVLQMLPERI